MAQAWLISARCKVIQSRYRKQQTARHASTIEGGASAADHTRHIIQNIIRLRLLLKQLHIRIEEISFGDVNALVAQFVNQLHDARRNRRFATRPQTRHPSHTTDGISGGRRANPVLAKQS